MTFTSVVFLMLFFPVSILFSYLMREEHRNTFLCICSALFYFWCGIKFLILILVSATLAWLFGICIEKAAKPAARRTLLLTALCCHLGTLFFYKYLFDLFPDFIRVWAKLLGQEAGQVQSPALPLGISFYTFSLLSYILDVYWEKCRAQRNIFNIWLYVLFFPKVVQGPIMRYSDFEAQLTDREVSLAKLNLGFERFIKGMFKKVMLADPIQPLVTYSFSWIEGIGTVPAWIGILAYLLQLYYDFSGYTDMAVGMGYMMGFELPENFDHPYMSGSVAEYWRRWHISLGEWFRDYVYMPCSRTIMTWKWLARFKKRKMLICDILALFITWVLTGIWHGSGSTYLVYGLWYFAFIAFERLRTEHRKRVRKAKKIPVKQEAWWQKLEDHVVTIFAVLFGQIAFRSESLTSLVIYWKKMLFWETTDGITFLRFFDNYMIFALVIGLIFIFPVYPVLREKLFERNLVTKGIYRCLLLAAAAVTFTYAVSAGYSAFLYEVF